MKKEYIYALSSASGLIIGFLFMRKLMKGSKVKSEKNSDQRLDGEQSNINLAEIPHYKKDRNTPFYKVCLTGHPNKDLSPGFDFN